MDRRSIFSEIPRWRVSAHHNLGHDCDANLRLAKVKQLREDPRQMTHNGSMPLLVGQPNFI